MSACGSGGTCVINHLLHHNSKIFDSNLMVLFWLICFEISSANWLCFFFNCIPTFMGHSMPKASLKKNGSDNI